jgi:hypothetical protein
LQQITEEDAIAEGMHRLRSGLFVSGHRHKGPFSTAVEAYYHLWKMFHRKPGERWEDNPQVVVADFDVVHVDSSDGVASL